MFHLSPAKRSRLILGGLLVVAMVLLLTSAYSALFPFLIGVFMVYLLLPVVNALDAKMPAFLQRRRLSRPLAILAIYLVLLLTLVGFFAIFVPIMSTQVSELVTTSGQYTIKIFNWTKGFNQGVVDEWLREYEAVVPDWIREALEANIQQLTAFLTSSLQDLTAWFVGVLQAAAMGALNAVTSTVSFVVGIVIVPFWVFYVLNDQEKLMHGAYSVIPERYRADAHNLQNIVSRALGAYLRGQLVLCFCVGAAATLGLAIMDINFAVLLGTVAGILEVIPHVGPFLGAVPAVLVALLKSPGDALQVAILFFAIQQVENAFLVPKVMGTSVRLHPAIVMIILVVGSQVGGLWGVVLGVPITAILRDVYRYLYLRSSDVEIRPEEAIAMFAPEGGAQPAQPGPWQERLSAASKSAYRAAQGWARKAEPRLKIAGRTLAGWARAAWRQVVTWVRLGIAKVHQMRRDRQAKASSGTDPTG
ncbi:MAG: AI-2E family transporter [Chloroflexi bacterium]|nr:AI-2E family transporter [Chloroflexota bacterium]